MHCRQAWLARVVVQVGRAMLGRLPAAQEVDEKQHAHDKAEQQLRLSVS